MTAMTDIVCLFNNMGLPVPPLCNEQKINFLVGISILSNQERELQKEKNTTQSCGEVGRKEETANSENRQTVSQITKLRPAPLSMGMAILPQAEKYWCCRCVSTEQTSSFAHVLHKGQVCGGGLPDECIVWASLHSSHDEIKRVRGSSKGAYLQKKSSGTNFVITVCSFSSLTTEQQRIHQKTHLTTWFTMYMNVVELPASYCIFWFTTPQHWAQWHR